MSDPVLVERVKLGASALNTLATASLTVGVIAPTAALFYGLGSPVASPWQLGLDAIIWMSLAAGLHYAAQRLLGKLHR